ncbi:MAG: helix-turn-helix domain-containing protein [Roseiflexus sp.]
MNQIEIERLLAQYPDMLTVGEVAAVLRVHPRSVQRWAQQGRFAVVRAGRTYRIPRTDVLRWMLGKELTTHAAEKDRCGEVSS